MESKKKANPFTSYFKKKREEDARKEAQMRAAARAEAKRRAAQREAEASGRPASEAGSTGAQVPWDASIPYSRDGSVRPASGQKRSTATQSDLSYEEGREKPWRNKLKLVDKDKQYKLLGYMTETADTIGSYVKDPEAVQRADQDFKQRIEAHETYKARIFS